MRRTRSVAAIVTVVVLCAAGCSDDDGSSEPTEQGDSSDEAADAETDGGNGSTDGEEPNADVSGVSVPLPPGADAVSTTESGPLTVVQFIVPLDQQADTIAFYDDWTGSQPDGFQRIAAEAGGVSWSNVSESGAERTMISVLAPLEGDDFVTVTLAVGPAE